MRQVRFADEHLNEYGFTADRCERHFNEWLPYVGHDNLGSALQAAGVAAELVALQNGPCDLACLYDARGDDGSIAVMLANDGDEEAPFTVATAGDSKWTTASRCRITDDARTWEEAPIPAALPPHSFAVILSAYGRRGP